MIPIKPITKKQKVVLECIAKYYTSKGYVPSVREICDFVHLSSPSTVHSHIDSLEQKGYLQRDRFKSRSFSLTRKAWEDLGYRSPRRPGFLPTDVVSIPLVGEVAAGTPILAEENITDHISMPIEIVGDTPSFMLTVRGESMIEAGINNGDYVVVKEQKVANNGEIVVALIDGGATVKRFFREPDCIRLQPENSAMDPILTRDCTILGKVVAVFRRVY